MSRLPYKTVAFLGLVLILFQTLYPFHFRFQETSTDSFFFVLRWGISNNWDILLNILLFMPFGFGLAGFLMRRAGNGAVAAVGWVFLVSFSLSYAIEVLQVFQPSRFPSLFDVFSNCTGGLLGFLLFRAERLVLFIYVVLVFILSILLQLKTDLANWETSFPLVIGNERTGDRPWTGHVSEVYLAARAIDERETAKYFSGEYPPYSLEGTGFSMYQFAGRGAYHDKAGVLPDLVWNGSPGNAGDGKGVLLGPDRWLRSVSPPQNLIEKIMETSQFTLIVNAAAAKTLQTGPARIVSLSIDPWYRNFTLGQERNDLIFRIRTPLTGQNGMPNMTVPGVFSSTDPAGLVITYDGSVLRIYVDSIQSPHVFELSPGAVMYSYFSPVNMSHLKRYVILWYAIIFIPLGVLVSIYHSSRKRRAFVLPAGILVPSLLIEFGLVIVSGRNVLWENVLISLLFTSGAMLLSAVIRK